MDGGNDDGDLPGDGSHAGDAFSADVARAVRDLAAAVGVAEQLTEEAVDEFVAFFAQLGADANRAIARGLEFDQAILDEFAFPHLWSFHRQVEYAFLRGADDPELEEVMPTIVESGIAEVVGAELLHLLLAWAFDPARPRVQQALASFLAFESIYASYVVAKQLSGGRFSERGGKARDLEVAASQALQQLREEAARGVVQIYPVASLLERAGRIIEERLGEFRLRLYELDEGLAEIEIEAAQFDAALERQFALADSADVCIIRNLIDEQPRKLVRLHAENPVAFGRRTYDWVRKRLERLRKAIEKGWIAAIPARRKPALIDMIRDRIRALAQSNDEEES